MFINMVNIASVGGPGLQTQSALLRKPVKIDEKLFVDGFLKLKLF